MHQLLLLNPENATDTEIANYYTREASRAVVQDDQGNIALLHVSKKGYYKLPGGGIDPGEDQLTALHRECLEEIGCAVEVTAEIGKIIEYRKAYSMIQISYCYCAKLIGVKGVPALMPDELADGFEVVWVPYSQALKLQQATFTQSSNAINYMVPRDLVFLKAATEFLHA